MFRVSLSELRRKGSMRVERSIPEDDPLWAGAELEFAGPAEVDLTLSTTASGQVLAVGKLKAPLVHECRRCLERVERPFEKQLEFLWSADDPLGSDDDGDVRDIEPGSEAIEIGEAVREELVLAAPMYVVCQEECRGLCPHCGTNLNEEQCHCVTTEPDSRWDALRALNKE